MAKAHRSALRDKAPGNFKHVFIDFENVPTIDLSLLGDRVVDVILFIGEKQRRLELGLVRQIHQHADQVTLVEVGASGRNALDLVLSWHLGKVAERYPKDPYFVVSKDRDFDPLISHLQTQGLRIERVEGFDRLPFLDPAPLSADLPPAAVAVRLKAKRQSAKGQSVVTAPTSPVGETRLAKLTARLQHKTTARPARRKTLLSHINGYYGKQLSESELEEVVSTLLQRGVVAIDPKGRVSYPDPGLLTSASAG